MSSSRGEKRPRNTSDEGSTREPARHLAISAPTGSTPSAKRTKKSAPTLEDLRARDRALQSAFSTGFSAPTTEKKASASTSSAATRMDPKVLRRVAENTRKHGAALAASPSGASSSTTGDAGARKPKPSSSRAKVIDLTSEQVPRITRRTRDTRPPSPDRPPDLEGTSKIHAIEIDTSDTDDEIMILDTSTPRVSRTYSVHGSDSYYSVHDSDSQSSSDSGSESGVNYTQPLIFHSDIIWPIPVDQPAEHAGRIQSPLERATSDIQRLKLRLPREATVEELLAQLHEKRTGDTALSEFLKFNSVPGTLNHPHRPPGGIPQFLPERNIPGMGGPNARLGAGVAGLRRQRILGQNVGRQLYDGERGRKMLSFHRMFNSSGAISVIQQDGPHEALIGSSVPSGMAGDADAIEDVFQMGKNAKKSSDDPRNESIMGSIMFRRVDLMRRGVLIDNYVNSSPDWNRVRAHFRRLQVTKVTYSIEEKKKVKVKVVKHPVPYDHYLTVNDAKFIPYSASYNDGCNQFLTSSEDGTVCLWSPTDAQDAVDGFFHMEDVGALPKKIWGHRADNSADNVYDINGLRAIPNKIAMNPAIASYNSAIQFAVACSNSGKVHIHSSSDCTTSWQHTAIRISNVSSKRNLFFNTESPCWGRGATNGWLFAGTDEADDEGQEKGGCYIAGIDTHELGAEDKAKPTWAIEAGSVQVLSVDPEGQRLAAVMNDPYSRHLLLKIYDLRAPRSTTPIVETDLDLLPNSTQSHPIPDSKHAGAASAAFSADGIFFALGRENNIVQVFDSRFLNHEFMRSSRHDLPLEQQQQQRKRKDQDHSDKQEHAQEDEFGITALEWVDATYGPGRSRNVLATGGNDGAVRVWDLRRSPDDPVQGQNILSEEPGHHLDGIGSFHLGDVYKRERALIVGDNKGTVQEYNDFPTAFSA